jgi:glyoxylate reductase
MKKILITHQLSGNPELLLKKKGYKVKVFKDDRTHSAQEFIKEAKDADGLLISLYNKIDHNVIDELKNCKIIANYGVGYNNIDVAYAHEKGIIVTNTPDILTDATADIAVAIVLACSRRLYEGESLMRQDKFTGWKPLLFLGLDLKGKTVGIIGAGRIGFATAKRLKAFGTKIIYYNRSKKEVFEKELEAKKTSLEMLLKTADIISVHLPLNESTFHILNKTNLSLMKSTAVFVNTARGEVVEEKYLIDILKRKKIFTAGFDVYDGEPQFNKELIKLDNVFLLPHLGSATIETRTAMSELCVKNIVNVLAGKKPHTPV